MFSFKNSFSSLADSFFSLLAFMRLSSAAFAALFICCCNSAVSLSTIASDIDGPPIPAGSINLIIESIIPSSFDLPRFFRYSSCFLMISSHFSRILSSMVPPVPKCSSLSFVSSASNFSMSALAF